MENAFIQSLLAQYEQDSADDLEEFTQLVVESDFGSKFFPEVRPVTLVGPPKV